MPDTDPPPPTPPRLPAPPPDTYPLLRARDSATFEDRATGQLDTLHHAGSLLKWRRHHPGETIELAQDNRDFARGLSLPLEGAWCARALPIESEEPIPALADSLTLAVRRRLTARYGKGCPGARLATWRSADWRNSTFWGLPAASVVAAAEGRGWLGRVFVLAWKPASGISSDLAESGNLRRDPETAMLRELIALGPLDSVHAERLIALRATAYWGWHDLLPATITDSLLGSALKSWLGAAETLPPRARSAALLLADRVLSEARLPSLVAAESLGPRSSLERLGARFERQPLGGGDYTYVNNWLWDSYRADRDGPVGQLSRAALRAGKDPRVCYRTVQRLTARPWSEVRTRGSAWLLMEFAAAVERRHRSPHGATGRIRA
ncbi:MAG: hypothetical protein H0V43_11280 [Gemmatimonadales bacterium]|nr:hypothetical protein [Gemmatimonadales bacterium]MBA3554340.1 hypothetical protein [Gemmatimonadales bacterium]